LLRLLWQLVENTLKTHKSAPLSLIRKNHF
jgi:hypothetical protein